MAKKIGDVYVRVHFSSDGKELRDDVEGDPEFEKAGVAAGNKAGDGFNDAWVKKLEEGMKPEGKVWDRRGAAIKGNITKITNEIGKIWDRYWKQQAEDGTGSTRELIERMQELRNEVDRELGRFQKLRDSIRLVRAYSEDLADKIKTKVSPAWDKFGIRLLAFDRLSSRVATGFVKAWEGVFGFLGRVTGRAGRDLDLFGDKVSKAFGAGARNDFINIFGRMIGGIVEVTSRLFTGMSKLFGLLSGAGVDALTSAGSAAAKAGEGSTALAEGAASASAESGGLIPIAFAAAIAVGALFGALSLAASAAMLLTGAIIALAGSLSFALVGGLAAAAGALVPVVAGVGVLILAIKGMDKDTKQAFSGLKDNFDKLSKVAAAHLFRNVGADAQQFGGIVDSILPLVAGIADALRDVGEGFLDAMSGPGAKKFIGWLQVELPDMIRQIGRIAINLGGFLGDAFVKATPLIEDFLGWLEGVTNSLSHLGDGVGSSSKLSGFFIQAQRSMHAVGDAIGEVLGLIGDLFSAGAPTGDDMFTSLANNVRRFRNFLADAKKDGSLQKFFDDAKKLAGAIGDAVIQVGKLVDALDTPESRKVLIFMVKAFARIIHDVAWLIGLVGKFQHLIVETAGKIGRLKGVVEDVAGKVKGVFTSAWQWVRDKAGDAVSSIRGKFNELLSFIKKLLSGDPGAWASAAKNLAEAAFHAIMSVFNGLPSAMVDLFRGLGGKIVDAIGSIVPSINWPDPPGWLKKVIPGMAIGGIIDSPVIRMLGEAGPEAVVPLTGPLSRVDPAVRELAAFARGQQTTTNGGGGNGRTISTGPITIITPVKDPAAVATQVVNRIAAASYF